MYALGAATKTGQESAAIHLSKAHPSLMKSAACKGFQDAQEQDPSEELL